MDIYLIIIIILIAFAVADLAVGVTNDAVNFLNSAAGSKTAPNVGTINCGELWCYFGSYLFQRHDGDCSKRDISSRPFYVLRGDDYILGGWYG